MDQIVSLENVDELIQAQTQIWNTSFSFMKSMSLKCAIELGIPDIIHNNGQPISLPDLISSLPIHPTKTQHVHRLMRILVHCGIFSLEKDTETNNKDRYNLTPTSRLLLKNSPINCTAYVSIVLEPLLVRPFEHLTTWFKNDDSTPLFTSSGDTLWGLSLKEPGLNNLFNESLACDSVLTRKMVMAKCKEVFEGIESLVDVGGGTGKMARAIAESFPNMNCTVLDQPHVVADLEGTNNMSFVGGDIFEAIPPADAVLLKLVLHDWSDEESVKILENCREAITKRKGKQGKIILIEIVIGNNTLNNDWTEAQLLFDIGMMSCVVGKERSENEWSKLFSEAGFSHYKIHPILGPRSLIELYP